MSVKVYNAILSYPGDNHLAPKHVDNVKAVCHYQTAHCLYNAMGGDPSVLPCHHVVQCRPGFDDLTVLVYGMFANALMTDGWTHLLKSDVNTRIVSIDWNAALKGEYAGLVTSSDFKGGISLPPAYKLQQSILRERFIAPGLVAWCGGPAYIASRRLVQAVVNKGVWAARGQWSEDVYIGLVAKELGITPIPAISYVGASGKVERSK